MFTCFRSYGFEFEYEKGPRASRIHCVETVGKLGCQ